MAVGEEEGGNARAITSQTTGFLLPLNNLPRSRPLAHLRARGAGREKCVGGGPFSHIMAFHRSRSQFSWSLHHWRWQEAFTEVIRSLCGSRSSVDFRGEEYMCTHTHQTHKLISKSHCAGLTYYHIIITKKTKDGEKLKKSDVKIKKKNLHLWGQSLPPGGDCYIMHSHGAIG